MLKLRAVLGLAVLMLTGVASSPTILPNGWSLPSVGGTVVAVGTFPQGLALSPNGALLAVVEGGYNPPALRILDAQTLATQRVVALKGAFGRPIWLNDGIVLVPGANSNAVLRVNVATGDVLAFGTGGRSWPVALALRQDSKLLATANDENGTISFLPIPFTNAPPVTMQVGAHPSDLRFSTHGNRLFVALRGANAILVLHLRTHEQQRISVTGDPCALATTATQLLVAPCDGRELKRYSLATLAPEAPTPIDLHTRSILGAEPIPNAIAVAASGTIYVSLGARNAIARIARDGAISFLPGGWYPTGVAVSLTHLYISAGNGDWAPKPNPGFNPLDHHYEGYTASSLRGAVARVSLAQTPVQRQNQSDAVYTAYAHLATQYHAPHNTPLRAHGPISHVIYIIKENRSYDQVLGDIKSGDGDAALASFGQNVTPNEHAIATQYGVFDRFFVDSRVSADGHNWTDAAIANDYVQRFWPADYAGRRKTYDFQDAAAPDVPENGYLWDAAFRAHITYRDYGEDVDPRTPQGLVSVKFPSLHNHIDTHYVGWDLNTSDLDREAEWQREFADFVSQRSLPQLEIVYLPNDHTEGTKPGALTPQAYVATNDLAVGRLIAAVSASPYWKSTAIFVVEDDAQNGPDHVSDQRSPLFVASAYSRGGSIHNSYDQASVLHTIEILLGLAPLTLNDRVAPPLYAAFTALPIAHAFHLRQPQSDMQDRNTLHSPGAAQSARIDWSRPDAANPAILNAILRKAARL